MLVHLSLNLIPKVMSCIHRAKLLCVGCFTYFDNRALATLEEKISEHKLDIDQHVSDHTINEAFENMREIELRNHHIQLQGKVDLF